jgi:adenylate cyclase
MPLLIFWRKLGADWRTRWWVTVTVFALCLGTAPLTFVKRLEWGTENARLKVRAEFGPAPHADLLLVGIDEETLVYLGQWPFPRSVHGVLLDWLSQDSTTRPAVAAWDLLFIDRNFDPTIDQAFADPLARAHFPVILGAASDPGLDEPGLQADGESSIQLRPLASTSTTPHLASLPDLRAAKLPLANLRAVALTAFIDAEADADGVVRRLPLIVRIGDGVYPSLVLQTLLTRWKLGPDAVEIIPGDRIILRRDTQELARIPIDGNGDYHLNYRYEHQSETNQAGIPTLGYWQIYEPLMNRYLAGDNSAPLPATGGKILLFGQVASGLTDIGPSPLEGKSAKVMVHLNALDNILKSDYRHDVPLAPVLAAFLALGLLAGWLLDRRGYRTYAIALPLAVIALVALATTCLVATSTMLPLVLPLGALALQQGAFTTLKIREEQARRDRIRGMFATYVAPTLVDRMVQSGEEPRLGGVEEEITAYFSDIESFSSFSEKLSPTRLVELMNEYLSACTDIVQAEGGTLDKFIGDAVVAMYGAPLTLPNHGHRAVVAALRVHRRCDELRAKWRAEQAEKGWPDIVTNLQTRIGLNVGRAVVGNMGSHTRFNYTMMGDTVNLAARMESGAKAYGVYTMVTETVVAASRLAEPDAVLFRPLDRIIVKGRSLPVSIYEAVALREDATDRVREAVAIFAEGLKKYLAQDWDGARACFERSLPLEPHAKNNPSLVLLERVAFMKTHPPGPDWDGVWRMTSK